MIIDILQFHINFNNLLIKMKIFNWSPVMKSNTITTRIISNVDILQTISANFNKIADISMGSPQKVYASLHVLRSRGTPLLRPSSPN